MEFLRTSALDQETPPASAPAAGPTETVGPPDGGPPAAATNPFMSFVPLILIIVVFYFVMIGPERKQRKKREAMLSAVKKGDKVVTTGGMFATVAAVNEDVLTLQVADDVRLRFSRQSIAQVIEDDAAESSSKS